MSILGRFSSVKPLVTLFDSRTVPPILSRVQIALSRGLLAGALASTLAYVSIPAPANAAAIISIQTAGVQVKIPWTGAVPTCVASTANIFYGEQGDGQTSYSAPSSTCAIDLDAGSATLSVGDGFVYATAGIDVTPFTFNSSEGLIGPKPCTLTTCGISIESITVGQAGTIPIDVNLGPWTVSVSNTPQVLELDQVRAEAWLTYSLVVRDRATNQETFFPLEQSILSVNSPSFGNSSESGSKSFRLDVPLQSGSYDVDLFSSYLWYANAEYRRFVPEPTSLPLVGLAILSIALSARRQGGSLHSRRREHD